MEDVHFENKMKTVFDGLGDDLFSIIPGIENASQVPIIMADDLTEKSFNKNWVALNEPCLVRGAVKHWPGVKKFKDESYWLSKYGDFDLKVNLFRNRRSRNMNKNDIKDTTFHEAIKQLYNEENYIYSLTANPMCESQYSEVLKEIKSFSFHDDSISPRVYEPGRFIIYRRTSTAWHFHSTDETLMCQVNGDKKVALIPSSVLNAKEVVEHLSTEAYLDGKTLNGIKDLKPVIAHVKEGDSLYIPPYWLHAVVPQDEEVGFTYVHCWKSPLHKFGNLSNYFVQQFYKGGLQPFRMISLVMPLLAICSGVVYGFKKTFRMI